MGPYDQIGTAANMVAQCTYQDQTTVPPDLIVSLTDADSKSIAARTISDSPRRGKSCAIAVAAQCTDVPEECHAIALVRQVVSRVTHRRTSSVSPELPSSLVPGVAGGQLAGISRCTVCVS